MRKKHYSIWIALSVILLMSHTLQGQVAIGDGESPRKGAILDLKKSSASSYIGGLVLPNVNITDLGKIPADFTDTDVRVQETNMELAGMIVYNTNEDAQKNIAKGYYMWDGNDWKPIAIDGGSMTITPKVPAAVDKDGGSTEEITVTDLSCNISGIWNYTIIAGNDYATVFPESSTNGKFKVNFQPNNTAAIRKTVVMVTNPCGKNSTFVFTQEAMPCPEPIITLPQILDNGSTSTCGNGSALLYLSSPNTSYSYVWTLNGIQIGTGTYLTATQSGRYVVYKDFIGCGTSNYVDVSIGSDNAPTPVGSITATNNGIICNGSTVILIAYNVPTTGTITWYKNGIKQAGKSGNQITISQSETGTWFAVMEASGCMSQPSNPVEITYNAASTPLIAPDVYVNGVPVNSAGDFCSNGNIDLLLYNYSAYSTAITVNWYNGQTKLGEGESLSATAPSTGNFLLRCVVTDNTGVGCTAETIITKSLSGTAPNQPAIIGKTVICGGSPASLTANVTGTSYEWYRGDTKLSENTQSISADMIGVYQVAVIQGSCKSARSIGQSVSLSDYPGLTWISNPTTVEPGNTKTFQVSGNYFPTEYTWTLDNPNAEIKNGQGTHTVSIKFPDNGTFPLTVNVSVVAKNECGSSLPLTLPVTVQPACSPVYINGITRSPLTSPMIKGNPLNMVVDATGTNPKTYTWKLNGNPIAGAPNAAIYNISDTQVSHSGVYTCEVDNCAGNSKIATFPEIRIIDLSGATTGSGVLWGETCFDIAYSTANDNATCGALSSRASSKADFSRSYTYTFKNSGTSNSNLDFVIEDPLEAVESYVVQTGIPNTLVDGGIYTISIKYKETLGKKNGNIEPIAAGRTQNNPVTVAIHAYYLDGMNPKKESLTVNIKDCSCCGLNGVAGLVTFGANTYKTHFYNTANGTTAPQCWMVENSKEGTASGTTYTGKTIGERGYYYTWSQANTTNKSQSPCPEGWRVPTIAEMNRLWTVVGATSADRWWRGKTIVDGSWAAGYYNGSTYADWGTDGYWWNSTNSTQLYRGDYSKGGLIQVNVNSSYRGSVRCVKE